MVGPKVIKDLGNGWSLKAWDYPDAPVELHGPGISIDRNPDELVMEIEYDAYGPYGSHKDVLNVYLPREALAALLGYVKVTLG